MSRTEELRQANKNKIRNINTYRSPVNVTIEARYDSVGHSNSRKNKLDTSRGTLPPVNKTMAFKYSTAITNMKKTTIQTTPSAQLVNSLAIRLKAEKELNSHAKVNLKNLKDVVKLKPIRLKKAKQNKKKLGENHLDVITNLIENNSGIIDKYYYCLKGNNFYEFYKCSFDQINADTDDYLTISSRGITHFVCKETEFLTISEWKNEIESYKMINQISFFRNFRIGKSFFLWRRLVKRTKMVERGSYLSKELFRADPKINMSLVSIRKLLNSLQSCNIFPVRIILMIVTQRTT